MIPWTALLAATAWVDFAVIVLSKVFPLTKSLATWYADFGLAGLDVGQEFYERGAVVAFGETLAVGEAEFGQPGHRVEEAVGGDEIDLGGAWPAAEQRLEDA